MRSRPKFRFAFFLLAFLVGAAACSSSDSPACKIADNGDGTRTITCPGAGPVRVVDGGKNAVCTIGSGDDGGKVISCTDGTVVRIRPDGTVDYPGSGMVEGYALLFGERDHRGIRVRAEGTGIETTTDENGKYLLGPLPSGIHELVFEAEGRVEQRRPNIPVIDGTWQLDSVYLRFARRIGQVTEVQAAPSGDAVLAFHPVSIMSSWIGLWDLDTGRETPLGTLVSDAGFSDDGRWVLYQERTAIDGPLVLWDRETDSRTVVTERSVQGAIAPGAEVVVYQARGENGECLLFAWRRENGSTNEVGRCDDGFFWSDTGRPWLFGHDGRAFAWKEADGELVLHDFPSGTNYPLGSADYAFHARFLPGSSRMLFVEEVDPASIAQELWLADPASGEVRRLTGGFRGELSIAPDGKTIAIVRDVGVKVELVAHRVEENLDLVLESESLAGLGNTFSPDGGRLLWTAVLPPGDPAVRVIDLESPENVATWYGTVLDAGFSAGPLVMIRDVESQIHLWNPLTDEWELLAAGATGVVWNPQRDRLAVATQDGKLRVADLTTGNRHVVEAPIIADLAWDPPGEALGYVLIGDPDFRLMRWTPGSDPVEIAQAGSIFLPGFSPSGTVLYMECNQPCSGASILLSGWDPRSRKRMVFDSNVLSYSIRNGILIYEVFVDPPDPERIGTWVMKLP